MVQLQGDFTSIRVTVAGLEPVNRLPSMKVAAGICIIGCF